MAGCAPRRVRFRLNGCHVDATCLFPTAGVARIACLVALLHLLLPVALACLASTTLPNAPAYPRSGSRVWPMCARQLRQEQRKINPPSELAAWKGWKDCPCCTQCIDLHLTLAQTAWLFSGMEYWDPTARAPTVGHYEQRRHRRTRKPDPWILDWTAKAVEGWRPPHAPLAL